MGRFDLLTQLEEKQDRRTPKKINSDKIIDHKEESPSPLPGKYIKDYSKQESVRPVRVVPPIPPTPSVKRVMKPRHPFDIYRDQYESLVALALEERKEGGVGSMSAMVREAIDRFIEGRKKKKK